LATAAEVGTGVFVGCSTGRGVGVAAAALVAAAVGAEVAAGGGASVVAAGAQAANIVPPMVMAENRKKSRRFIFFLSVDIQKSSVRMLQNGSICIGKVFKWLTYWDDTSFSLILQ
jgi:hypothetical protein